LISGAIDASHQWRFFWMKIVAARWRD